jgi:hypothetical protein
MFGLILAALAVAYQMLMKNTEPVVAVESVLPFLWYWHMTWACVKFCVWLIVPVLGGLFGIGGSTRGERNAGVGFLLVSPFILCLMMISSILFLGGVYGLDSGLQGGEMIKPSHVVVGGVLYGLALLSQRLSAKASNSRKDD